MSGSLGSLVVELSANIAKFQSDMGKAAHIAQENMDKVKGSIEMAKRALAVFGVGLAAGGFAEMIKGSIDAADQLGKLSQKTGVSVEALSGLKYSAALADVSLEGLGKGLEKLSKNMLSVEQGAGSSVSAIDALGVSAKGGAAGAFKQLNINVEESKGHLKSSQDVMLEVADRFVKMQDGAAKTGLAMAIFGKAGADLIPLLNQGSEAIKAQREEAERLGIVFSEETAKAAEELNDNLKRLHARMEGVKNTAAEALLPALNDIVLAFVNLNSQRNESDGFFSAVATGAKYVAVAVGSAWLALKDMAQGVSSLYEQSKALVNGEFELVKKIGKERDAQAAKNEQDFHAFQKGILQGPPSTVNGMLAEQNKGFDTKSNPTINGKGSNGTKSKSPGEAFIEGLQRNIEKIGLGEYAMLRLEAAQKKVSATAEPYIKQLEKTTIAHQDLIDREKARIDTEDALIERMNKSSFEDPGKIYDYIGAQKKLIQETEFMTSLFGKTALEQKLLTEARKVDLAVLEMSKDLNQENTDALREQAAVIKGDLTAAMQASNTVARTWQTGASEAFNTYIDDATNAAKQANMAFTNAFKGIEDALVNFTKTGKLDFKSLANSIITDLIRIQIQQSITGPLAKGAKDNGYAGLISAGASLLGFADGGSPPVGVPSIVGERGPELFIPNSAGKIIPNSAMGGGGQTFVTQIDARGADAGVLPKLQAMMEANNRRLKSELLDNRRRNGAFA